MGELLWRVREGRSSLDGVVGRGPSLLALAALMTPAFADAQTQRYDQQRWAEDWSGASNVPFKDIEFGDDISLTLGGDARWRAEMLDAPHLGITSERRDSWMLQRLMAHADLHVGEHARVFAQIGSFDAIGREVKNVTDDDRLDLTQGFLDINETFGSLHATLRLGRQELYFGSPRFVTFRDNTNVRQSHDSARLMLSDDDWTADFFSGRPTQPRVGSFDDRSDPRQEFFGARLERRFGDIAADLEYFDLARDNFTVAGVTANDRRRSFGARVTGRAGFWDFDTELLDQTGTFGAQHVAAFGGAIDVGRTFPREPFSPRAGARITYGSGDPDPLDTKQQTFAPPFPRNAWFGQSGLGSFSNSVEAAALLGLAPNQNTSLEFKVAGLWRADTHDFAYAGSSTTLPGTRGGDSFMAITPSIQLVWRVTPNVTVAAYASAVWPSRSLRDDGANQVSYVQTTLALRY